VGCRWVKLVGMKWGQVVIKDLIANILIIIGVAGVLFSFSVIIPVMVLIFTVWSILWVCNKVWTGIKTVLGI
jgi:hypothetical protein